jgi:WD40 repeat protein
MSRIFLSHSSKDNDRAVALGEWLAAQGWDDVFLDLDPLRGIAAGDQWARALNQAALRCEAVLFLVSRAWLDSDWCLKEFNLAHRLNKRLFGLLIEDIPISDLPAMLTGTWQLVPLASGRDHVMLRAVLPGTHDEVHVTFSQEGLTRLRVGLERAGLDARFFAWPPDDDLQRPPYRGLLPLEVADAGIFFGREAPTVEALDRIRGIKDGAAPRLLILLGASGAGKSSFLRAGLLPHLARDDRNYLPLPVIRPEHAAINGEAGLLRSFETAFAERGLAKPRAEIREAIKGGAAVLQPMLQALTAQAQKALITDDPSAKAPVLVLAIDQGEELFQTDGASEGTALLTLLRALLVNDDPALLTIITIRSDAYEQLQITKSLEGISQQTLSLIPMPRGAYQAVIEGPAARLKETDRPLVIEPGLTQAVLSDIEEGGGRDALPLLAFTLERLYLEYGGRGRLTLKDYDALGRIKGSIEAAIEHAFRAADNDSRIPRNRDARLTLLRRGLIPWLAGIDPDTGSPRRQKARLSEIPEEARPLIDALVEQRLLSTDVNQDTGERTIEPAHEALLRQWGSLQGWLHEDFAALTNLGTVKRAARDWAANGQREDWLAHRAGRLEDAERLLLRPDLAGKLDATDRDYLAACRKREYAEQAEKTIALKRRLLLQRLVIVATSIAVIIIGIASWTISIERDDALRAQSRFLSQSAGQAIASGDAVTATLLAMEALPDKAGISRPFVSEAALLLLSATQVIREQTVLPGTSNATFDHTGRQIATASTDGVARIWDTNNGKELFASQQLSGSIRRVTFSPDDRRLLTESDNGSVQILDIETRRTKTLASYKNPIRDAVFNGDATRVIIASGNTVEILDSESGRQIVLLAHINKVNSIALSPDGRRVLTTSDTTARTWDSDSGQEILPTIGGHQGRVSNAIYSPDGSTIATISDDHWGGLWDAQTGKLIAQLDHTAKLNSVNFSADGNRIVTASDDKTTKLWDGRTGKRLEISLRPHDSYVLNAVFSPDGNSILTTSGDLSARISSSVTGSEIAVLKGHGAKVGFGAFSLDGRQILTVSDDKTARIWNARVSDDIITFSGHLDSVWSINFSPDPNDHRVITASDDHTVRIWDSDRSSIGRQVQVFRFKDSVNSAAFSPDGKRFAAALDDGTARIAHLETGQQLTLKGHSGRVNSVIFSHDGRSVLTASDDGTARLWDAEAGITIQVFRGHTGNVNSAVFSSDGSRVLTASDDQTARIWDSKSGHELQTFKGHRARVNQGVFAPDEGTILTASWDNTARLWDSHSGQPIAELRGHRGPVNSAGFSPDGKRIVTASWDGSARIWDRETANAVASLDGHRGHLFYGVFSSDGQQIATASEDHTARIWRIRQDTHSVQQALDFAKSRVPRCLTVEQRKEFFLDEEPPRWCDQKWPYLHRKRL